MMKKAPKQHSPIGAFMLGTLVGLSAIGIFALCETGKAKQWMQKAKTMGKDCIKKGEELSACLQTNCHGGASKDTAETATAFYSTKEEVPHVECTCFEEDMRQSTPKTDANEDAKGGKNK